MTYDREAVAVYRKWRDRLLSSQPPQSLASHRACLFLASHGKAFLSDFGFANAQQKASELRAKLKAKRRKR